MDRFPSFGVTSHPRSRTLCTNSHHTAAVSWLHFLCHTTTSTNLPHINLSTTYRQFYLTLAPRSKYTLGFPLHGIPGSLQRMNYSINNRQGRLLASSVQERALRAMVPRRLCNILSLPPITPFSSAMSRNILWILFSRSFLTEFLQTPHLYIKLWEQAETKVKKE